MFELPPTYGRSRVDLVVLAMLVALVVAGGFALAFGRASVAEPVPAKAPSTPTATLNVS